MDILLPYGATLAAGVALAALLLIQTLVADFAGIRARHVPGMPVTEGHGSFHFRAVRAQANTNETLGLALLLAACALALQASPAWVNGLAWTYVAARAAHMACYYARLGLARSIAFGIGLAAQAGLLLLCAQALI